MEITSITPGCGCITATASKRVLEPNVKATLDVNMDARRFVGGKTVIIRVTVGPEFISSAEVKVTALSRADVVFNPGDVGFGAFENVLHLPGEAVGFVDALDFWVAIARTQ